MTYTPLGLAYTYTCILNRLVIGDGCHMAVCVCNFSHKPLSTCWCHFPYRRMDLSHCTSPSFWYCCFNSYHANKHSEGFLDSLVTNLIRVGDQFHWGWWGVSLGLVTGFITRCISVGMMFCTSCVAIFMLKGFTASVVSSKM